MAIRRRGSLARRHPERRIAPQLAQGTAFEQLVERALDGLPDDIRRLLANVAIVVEDEPPDGEWLYGLYEGTPVVEYAADQVPFPNKITLFRVALEEDFPRRAELAQEVRRTVVHELAHHAGFDDGRLRELGYD